ncbi:hypothetical protein EMCRGX_G025280 [Ephydatia muelleri]
MCRFYRRRLFGDTTILSRKSSSSSCEQQGDPLGSFALDLLYQAWYLDDGALAGKYECRDLLYQAWYLDNGALAGNCPAVIQVSRFGRRLSSKIDEDLCLGLPVWPTKLDFCLCQSLLAISSPLPWAQVYTWSPMRSKSAVHEIGILLLGLRLWWQCCKHRTNDPKCSELGWKCIPPRGLPVSCWGAEARGPCAGGGARGLLSHAGVLGLGDSLSHAGVRGGDSLSHAGVLGLGTPCLMLGDSLSHAGVLGLGDSLSHAGVLRLGDSLSHAGVLRLGDSLSHAGVLRLGDSLSHAGVLRLGDSLSHAGVLGLGTPCLVSRLAAPMWCTKSPGYCCHLWQTHLTLSASFDGP